MLSRLALLVPLLLLLTTLPAPANFSPRGDAAPSGHRAGTPQTAPPPALHETQGRCQPRRNPDCRSPNGPPNPPTVTLSASSATVNISDCAEQQQQSTDRCTPSPERGVRLTAVAVNPYEDTLLYTYSVTGGRVTGDGADATWDLSGVPPGIYTATVEVDNRCGCVAFTSVTVTVERCACVGPLPCPSVNITARDDNPAVGQPLIFSAPDVGEGAYNWTVSEGTILQGQGTPTITVDTTGLRGGSTVSAIVDVGGRCSGSASASVTLAFDSIPPEDQTALTGVVKDRSGNPIGGAAVTAVKTANGFSQTATTDAAGRYTLNNLQEGRYRVTATHDRHRQQRKNANLGAGDQIVLNFELSPR